MLTPPGLCVKLVLRYLMCTQLVRLFQTEPTTAWILTMPSTTRIWCSSPRNTFFSNTSALGGQQSITQTEKCDALEMNEFTVTFLKNCCGALVKQLVGYQRKTNRRREFWKADVFGVCPLQGINIIDNILFAPLNTRNVSFWLAVKLPLRNHLR